MDFVTGWKNHEPDNGRLSTLLFQGFYRHSQRLNILAVKWFKKYWLSCSNKNINKRVWSKEETLTTGLDEESFNQWQRLCRVQFFLHSWATSSLAAAPPPTPCSWLVPGLLHTSRCCTSPLVQRHTEGASRLMQGENQPTISHHRVPLPVVSGFGRKVRKRRICCFHIIKQVRGIAGTKQGQSTCLLGHHLCFFLFFLACFSSSSYLGFTAFSK